MVNEESFETTTDGMMQDPELTSSRRSSQGGLNDPGLEVLLGYSGAFRQERNYLVEQGFRLSSDGTRMIP